MTPANPFLGVLLHSIGGLAAASFYIPFKRVRNWSWETYWLVNGFFSWIIAPAIAAGLLVPGAFDLLRAADSKPLCWAYFWGAMWGIGGLTFGLSVRYLGVALGYGIALGFCAAFGTLVPPIFEGKFLELLRNKAGLVTMFGVAVSLVGIVCSAMSGMSKERELSDAEKKKTVSEFNFVKGLLVAIFAGVMSSCMSYGFQAGKPIAEAAKASLLADGRTDLWQNLPVLIVVLWGGFTTNFLWCVFLHLKNKSGGQYRQPATPLAANYLFAALAGVTWYLQFFFYSMGSTRMGKFEFSSWSLHMASIIIFSTVWGVVLKEWKGTSKRTHTLIGLGLLVLIASMWIVGYGNKLAAK